MVSYGYVAVTENLFMGEAETQPIETDSEFEVVADHLADELAACLGANCTTAI